MILLDVDTLVLVKLLPLFDIILIDFDLFIGDIELFLNYIAIQLR
jgi:hypothetical protein